MHRRALLLVALPAFVPLLSGPAAAQSADWTEPFDPVRVADDVYYVGSRGLSSFLFTSAEGHILVDPTVDENVPGILESVRSLGFDPADIRVVLVTHAHWDHVGGLASLLAATGAELRVSEADAPFVEAGRDFGFESDGYAAATVDALVGDGETVRVGDAALTAVVTPGHTPGCTSWRGTVRVAGVERSFVLVCSLSVLALYDLAGDNATYAGQADDFCRSLARLEALEADIFLSNHGGFFGLAGKAERARAGEAEAFVDPEGLPAFLVNARRAIDEARVGQGLAACG